MRPFLFQKDEKPTPVGISTMSDGDIDMVAGGPYTGPGIQTGTMYDCSTAGEWCHGIKTDD